MYRLFLFGGVSLETPSGPASGRVLHRHRLALLALLAVCRPGHLSRDKLVGLLWPDRSEKKARHSLADSVYVLRRELGEEAVVTAGDELRLDPGAVWTDVGAFRDALSRAEAASDEFGRREALEEAVELYTGPFLDGFHGPDATAFEEWADAERRRLGDRYGEALEELAEATAARGDGPAAVALWKRRAAHEPTNSRVAIRLMEALAASGNSAGAVRHARVHELLLEERLGLPLPEEVATLARRLARATGDRSRDGTPPSRSAVREEAPAGGSGGDSSDQDGDEEEGTRRPTREVPLPNLFPAASAPSESLSSRRIGRGQRNASVLAVLVGLALVVVALANGRNPDDAAPAPTARRSLVVLPFESPNEADAETLAHGMHEALHARLSAVAGLRVISRTSARAYRRDERSLPEMAGELGVDWVVEGSVYRLGDEIEVNAALIDPATDTQVWAESFRRRMTADNLFAMQNRITRQIARALEIRLTPQELDRLGRTPTDNLAAYELYVRGRYLANRRTVPDIERSIDLFRQAIDEDSTYAAAYSGLADSYLLLADYRETPTELPTARAERAARTALAFDPLLGEAHATLGTVNMMRLDWQSAIREYAAALELRPSYGQAWFWYGWVLTMIGQGDAAREAILRAAEFDPLHPAIRTAVAHTEWGRGEMEAALESLRRTLELSPAFFSHDFLAIAYSSLDRHDEALAASARGAEAAGPRVHTTRGILPVRAVTLIRAGRTDEGRQLMREAEEGGVRPFWIGIGYAGLGEDEKALQWLRRTEWDYKACYFTRVIPWLDRLRANPRFRAFERGRNEVLGLGPDGTLPEETASLIRRSFGTS